ncbi:MAG: PD40 domain-containing protein [Bacteroidia bacterium]|nr:PD40 domain-containing protein [Bacteroidia bacterium]
MKKNKTYLFIILLLTTGFNLAFAQNKNADKETKALLKEAQYNIDGEDYLKAWQLYKKILKLDAKNELAGVNAAYCISKLNYSQDSAQRLVNNLTSSKQPDAKYYLAKYYHKQKLFNEAITQLNAYLKTEAKKRAIADVDINYLLNTCNNAKAIIAKPHLSVIKNMGENINSEYDDYVPVIVPDESAIYFTSKRKGSSNNRKNGDNSYYEDVYVSAQVDGKWKKAENAGFPINTNNNDACVAMSADGHRMIIYRTSESDESSGDLYTTHLGDHGHWETLKKMGYEINSQFIETSACFSKDTNELYFSSNRPGGYGGKDIYRIKRLPNGHWAMPYNLGPNVNTSQDEDAPFLHPDGITLYFSSKGHNTMGDYDVFKSVIDIENNLFTPAENLGYPINDVGNDVFFVLSVDGKRAYYSSTKKETFGGTDLYQIDTRFGDNDLVVRQGYTYLDNAPARVQITLIDNESNEIVGNYVSNPNTGKFILVVNPLKSYKIILEEEGYTTLETDVLPMVLEKTETNLKYSLKKSNAK